MIFILQFSVSRLNNVNKTHLGSSLNFERANEQTKYISIII